MMSCVRTSSLLVILPLWCCLVEALPGPFSRQNDVSKSRRGHRHRPHQQNKDFAVHNNQHLSGTISLLDPAVLEAELQRSEKMNEAAFLTKWTGHNRCSTHKVSLKVSYRGCVPRQVILSACKGTCRSWTVPEWISETQSIYMVQNCQCCKPLVRRPVAVRLHCPHRTSRTKKVIVWAPLECSCRPCSDDNPDSEITYANILE